MLADAAETDLNLVRYAQSPGRPHVAVYLTEVIFRVDYLMKRKRTNELKQETIDAVLHSLSVILPVRRSFEDSPR